MGIGKIVMVPGFVLLGLLSAFSVRDGSASSSEPAELAELAASSVGQRSDLRAERLAAKYDEWRTARHREPDKYEIALGLSWFPGVSAERSNATGLALIDIGTGAVSVELNGIDLASLADVWLIDHRPGEGASAMPDPNDVIHLVGSLEVNREYGWLRAQLDPAMFRNFDVDQIVIARRGEGPIEGGLLYGSLSLFERVYRASRRNEQGLAPIAGDESSRQGLLGSFPVPGLSAAGSLDAARAFEALVVVGEFEFSEETFDGNGRTCATCHPAANNFTLDKAFIAKLPPDDPLFVAEFLPALDKDQNGGLVFENPTLMREFALITENPEGFDDLRTKFVQRSPNHLFGLALSIEPALTPCHPVPPEHRLGWGGDGAPGSGTLREFAIAAVIQHTPLTMGRVDGEDFRLPTEDELDALEAFQLTLGRQSEHPLAPRPFHDPDVIAGRDLFIGDQAKCSVCHEEGGALRRSPTGGKNFNFDIGIFNVPHPAEGLGEEMPFDHGFGGRMVPPECSKTFSTPSVIEAADTPPFSHNNVFATLEEAIGHYSTPAFNDMSSAGISITGEISLTELEINQLGALLRVLNSLQNLEDVELCNERSMALPDLLESRELLAVCIADNIDAKEVLQGSPIGPLHPAAITQITAAVNLHRRAQRARTVERRDTYLADARGKLVEARAEMIGPEPPPASRR